MASVKHPKVLAAVYAALENELRDRNIPTLSLLPGRTIYHSCNVKWLPPPTSGPVPRSQAEEQIKPYDGETAAEDRGNRFSGPSYGPIRSSGGLYCVLQQQALVNEAMYYHLIELQAGAFNPISGADKLIKPGLIPLKKGSGLDLGERALANKCVLQFVLTEPMLVADLSPHNPGLERFLKRMESVEGIRASLDTVERGKSSLWEAVVHSSDCSVARGMGLAIANSGYLRGLCAQTVRPSERSAGEKGDNLVLFGPHLKPIQGLSVEKAIYFSSGAAQVFPVG